MLNRGRTFAPTSCRRSAGSWLIRAIRSPASTAFFIVADTHKKIFQGIDDLVVAISEHEALFISQSLVRRARLNTLDDVRDTLVAFGLVASREYSTTLVGFIRMMMAEGARNPSLKKRVYEAGSEIVTRRLREFLSEANEKGILSISDAQVCAEQLMGLLREPLYQALMLNPVTSQKVTAADRVKAGIERFLHGCASARSARYERTI